MLEAINSRLKQRLSIQEKQRHLRSLKPPLEGVDFASNDYLGLSKLEAQGTPHSLLRGATGSRLLSGNSIKAQQMEALLAQEFKCEAALLFNSGYALNSGILQAVATKGDVVLIDEFAHASLKNGLKLCQADCYYFRHNKLDHLEARLKRLLPLAKGNQCFVIVESVYSMDGDLCPLAELSQLCEAYDCALICDEAHGLGTIGSKGEGLVGMLNLEEKVFARILTFGKAVGSHGAALLGSSLLMETMINFCHSFIYTTALPEHSLHTLEENLKEYLGNQSLVAKLQKNIAFMNKVLGSTGHQSPIYSIRFGNLGLLENAHRELEKLGMTIYPIYSPTVKKGSERLRVVVHAFNTEAEMITLGKVLKRYEASVQ